MTFSAGSIESTLTLDRRPFQTELARAKKDAQDFARQKYNAKLGLDTAGLKAEMDDLKAKLDLATRDREIKIKVKTDDVENGLKRVSRQAQDTEKQLGLLSTAIILGGPPAVVLAGGLAAITAGAAGLGITGVAAFVGIKNEVKANTAAGKEYKTLLGSLKGDLATVSQTSALGVKGGITDAVTKLRAEVPQLNGFLSQSSVILGDIVSHLTGGLVGGLRAFTPLILEVEQGADHIAASFEKWATGPGGEKFAKTLGEDYRAAVPALKSLGELTVTLVSALNGPAGIGMLHIITAFAETISSFPLPVLKGIVVALVALRTAALISAIIDKLSLSLVRLGAAEDEAGGAGAGGKLGGILSTASRYAVGLFAVGLAAKSAANSLGDYVHQTNQAKYETGQVLDSLGKIFTGHIFSGFSSIFGNNDKHSAFVQSVNQMAGDIKLGQGGAGETGYELQTLLGNKQQTKSGTQYTGTDPATAQIIAYYHGSSAQIAAAVKAASDTVSKSKFDYDALLKAQATLNNIQSTSATNLAVVNDVRYGYTAANNQANTTASNYALRQNTYTDATSGLASYSTQLTKNIANEKTWNALQIDSAGNVNESSKSLAVWKTALTDANGDTRVAIGLVKGHQQAYLDDIAAQKVAQVEQDRINGAVSQAATAYGLSAGQVQLYGSMVGITAERLGDGAISGDAFTRAVGDVNDTVRNGSTAMDAWSAAVSAFSASTDTIADRANLIGAALKAANGDTIDYQLTLASAAQANQQLVTDMANAKKGIIDWSKATVDWHTAGGAQLLQDLQGLQTAAVNSATAVYQHATAMGDAHAADEAFTAYQQQTQGSLITTAEHFGATKKQAQQFADTYFGIKNAGDLKKTIELAGKDNVTPLLQQILNTLRSLDGLPPLTFDVVTNFDANTKKLFQYAATNKQVEINSVAGANGLLLNSYANGGSENHVAQMARGGAWRVWAEDETEGESYIPHAQSKRPRSLEILKQTARILGARVIGLASGGSTDPDLGFTGVDYGSTPSGGSSSSSNSKYKTLLAAVTSELVRLAGASKLTVGQISSLSSVMLTSAKTAQSYGLITTAALKTFTTDATTLTNAATLLGNAETKLKNDTASYKSLVSSDTKSLLGGFDIGTSGNGYAGGILTTLQNRVSDASKFKDEIAQAQRLGLGQDFIKQLIKEGPTTAGANLQAILSQAGTDPSYIGQLNSNYIQLGKLGGSLGTTDANLTYGPTLAADKATVAKDTKAQLDALNQIHKDLVAVEVAVSKKTKS
jgi:hypothetical protein